MKRIFSALLVMLILVSVYTLSVNIQPVKAAGTIYIRADGSIDPPTASISTVDNVTYTLTGNITSDAHGIIVERSNIIVDGAGYTLQGPGDVSGDYKGIDISGRSNVKTQNINIENFHWGVSLSFSSNNSISRNNITDSVNGIYLLGSTRNSIRGNTITNSYYGVYFCANSNSNVISGNNITANTEEGIMLASSSNNRIFGNNITATTGDGIFLIGSLNNSITENSMANNWEGVCLYDSSNNSIRGNNIKANIGYGVYLDGSFNNRFYHNNFIDNTHRQVFIPSSGCANVWDEGYPSGGNYWSDYNGTDICHGPHQNETGSDGIGDTPYGINADNQDHSPLMKPYGGLHDVGIISLTTSKSVVGQGCCLNITIKALNYGISTETFNITTYANTTIISALTNVTLTNRNSTAVTFIWNTTDWPKGNYTISANVTSVPGETDTADNHFTDCWIVVTILGDVDGDHDVDIYDIVKIADAYNSEEGDTRYFPEGDFDNDGDIDIYDVVIAAGNYGKSW